MFNLQIIIGPKINEEKNSNVTILRWLQDQQIDYAQEENDPALHEPLTSSFLMCVANPDQIQLKHWSVSVAQTRSIFGPISKPRWSPTY